MKMIKILNKKALILSVTFLLITLFTCEAFALSKITSIAVKDDTVKIEADNKLNYKVDKTDPFNIIVDIDNAQLLNPQDKPYTSQKGVISELRAVQGRQESGNKVRILMALNTPAEIETKNSDNSLYINVARNEAHSKEAYQLTETDKQVIQESKEPKKEALNNPTTSQDTSTTLATEVIAVFIDKVQNGAELIIKGNGLMPDPVVYNMDNKIVIELEGLKYNAYIPKTMIFPFKDVKVQAEGNLLKFLIEPEKEVMLAYFRTEIDIDKNVHVLNDEVIVRLYESKVKKTDLKVQEQFTEIIPDLDFKDAEVKGVITKIARSLGYNIIVDNNVSGSLTLSYKNITFEKAIDIISNQASVIIKKDKESRTLLVKKGEIFKLGTGMEADLISVDLQDADLSSVLYLISDISGYNLFIHPDVKDIKYRVNTKLTKVTWQKALAIIVNMYNLDISVDEIEKVIVVAPIETITKIEKTRQEFRDTRLKEFKAQAELYTEQHKIAKERLQAILSEKKITKIIYLKYLSTEEAVSLMMGLNIFPGASGTTMKGGEAYVVDKGKTGDTVASFATKLGDDAGFSTLPYLNAIVVRHVPQIVNDVEEFLKSVDKPGIPAQQVTIETRIVEISDTADLDLGVQWGISGWGATKDGGILSFGGTRDAKPGQSLSDYATTPYSQVGVGQATQGTMGSTNIMPLIINMPATVAQGAGGSFGIGYINKAASMMLDFRLSALENVGKGKIITQPKITTLNGQSAKVFHGTKIPITTPGSTQGSYTTNFIEAGIDLSVTPLISLSQKDVIYLGLNIKKEEPLFSQKDMLGNPAVQSRSTNTKVALKDGETVVIGGIVQYNTQEYENSVPGLSKIPLLGNLFKRETKNNKREELLIFITPKIVEHIKEK